MPTSPLRIATDQPTRQMVVADQLNAQDSEQMLRGDQSQLARGWRAGLTGMSAGAFAADALAGERAGTAGWQTDRDTALQMAQEASAIGPRVSSLRDVHGVDDALDYAAGAFGQGSASMVPTIGAALLTRGKGTGLSRALPYLGAAVPGYALEKDEAVLNQYADPVQAARSADERDRVASYKGLANAALESIVPGSLGQTMFRKEAGSLLGRIGREAATEAATEAAQEYTGYLARKQLNANEQLDPWALADAAAMGGITGGGMTTVTQAPGYLAGAAADKVQGMLPQAGEAPAAPQEPGPTPQGPAPVEPMPDAPSGFGAKAQDLYEGAAERFGPKVEEAYDSAKDYASAVIDRMNTAVRTAQTPQDFIQQVFRPDPISEAEDIATPDENSPDVLGAEDPVSAINARDSKNAQRVSSLAEDLLADPATPDVVREKIVAMGGDFSDRAAQAYVASTYAGVKGGRRLVEAVSQLGSLVKGLGGRIRKNNLQDLNDADMAPLVSTLAQRLAPSGAAAEAPNVARQLVAAANRLSERGDIDERVDQRLRALSKVVDDDVLDAVTAVSGSDGLRNAIAKIRAIPSAEADLRQAPGASFLESMVKQPLTAPQKAMVAKLIDSVATGFTSMNKTRRDNALGGLAVVFGSRREAQVVLEYYGNLKRAAYKREAESGQLHEDRVGDVTEMFLDQPGRPADATYEGAASTAEWGALTENDGPGVEVGFRGEAAKRPFRKFAGEKLSDGKVRREAWRAINDARGREDADYATQDYSEYLAAQGIQPEEGLSMVRRDIERRIKEHESRKGEDRSAAINELRGELELLETTASDKGAKAALDQYEVITRSARAANDVVATNDDLKSMQTAARARPETAVQFRRVDGSVLTLSAESMIKTLGLRRRQKGGVVNPKQQNKQQALADAAASVLARDDIAGMISDLRNVVMDPASGRKAQRSYSPDRLEALSRFEELQEAKRGGVPARRAFIRAQLEGLETALDELGDPASATFDEVGLEDMRDEWQASAREAVAKATARTEVLDAARSKAMEAYAAANADKRERYQDFERARAALDYARSALRDYVQFQRDVDSLFADIDKEVAEAEKSGVPEADTNEPAIMRTEEEVRSGVRTQTNAETDALLKEDPEKLTRLNRRGEVDERGTERARMEARSKQSTIGDEGKAPKTKAEYKALRSKLLGEIRRIRGNDVKLRFNRLISQLGESGEFSMNDDRTERVIEVAVNAANPMGVAWHESLHDFFAMLDEDRVSRSIKRDLIAAADAPHVKRKLRELLKDHPKALEQIASDPEERVAYMYQFWSAGELTLGPTGTGIFNKISEFFRDLFKVVGTEQRAADLLTALHEGRFADPSVVAEVLADMPRDKVFNRLERFNPAITDALQKMAKVAPDRLRAYQNEKLNGLADELEDFVRNRFRRDGEWTNRLAGILQGTNAAERRAALDNLQAMKVPSTPLERELAKFFSDMHDYLVGAGVKTFDAKTKQWVPLRKVERYFPRVFDRDAITKDRDGFKKLLMDHGGMDARAAENVIKALVHGTGQLELAETDRALGFSPYARAVQDRQLTFINPSNATEFAKYQSKDLADVATTYVKQAVHRAEYTMRFDNDGEKITKAITDSGISDKGELEDIGKIVRGLEGSLGYEMSNETKELMSGIMTLQNLVILPLAIFSQMVDPIVLAARSGDLRDAGRAYITAVKKLVGAEIDGKELAEFLGTVSQETVLDAMGVAYGTTHMSKRMRNINRVFFKYNGMQGWNDSMRIAATVAGERYLLQNRTNTEALAELGLTPADVKVVQTVGPNGMRDGLDFSSQKVKDAMFQFVDQSVIRPSAANRPVWMSDPRFLLVAHLKQFTFAMNSVVLKRANRLLDEGDPKPWGILLLAVPTILAADMAKFALTGGPPPGWAFKDFLVHAVERSGLLGLGDFGVQAMKGVDQGRMPGEALLGPTFEHLMTLLRALGGAPNAGVIDRTVPGARFV